MSQKSAFRVAKKTGNAYRRDYPSELRSDTTMLIATAAPPNKRHLYRLFLIDFDRLYCSHYGHAEITINSKTIPLLPDQISSQLASLYEKEEALEAIDWLLSQGALQKTSEGVIWHPVRTYGIPKGESDGMESDDESDE